ncbi:MAG: peptidylprolyl isomerase [Bacteroidota bacterium]
MNISRAVSRIGFLRRRSPHGWMRLRIAACAVLAAIFCMPQIAAAANTIVRMVTTLGTIDIQLYDDQAPITVTNFLRYAGRGDYDSSVISRSVPGFVIQGGGHRCLPNPFVGMGCYKIQTDPPIQNEFSPTRSNIRGTIAMAKLPNNQDSATNEWFFNLADNSANLDYQNGGFTVFGCVLDSASAICPSSKTGMAVVDAIAALPIFDGANNFPYYYPCNPQNGYCTNPTYFDHLPTYNYNTAAYNSSDQTTYLQTNNLVVVNNIPNVTATKTLTTQTTSAYAADPDVTLQNPNSNTIGSITYTTVDATTSTSWLAAFTPPPGKTVQFNDEISQFKMTWPAGSPTTRVVTLYHGAASSVNAYYAYGPTSDNPTPHWYDFSYDGQTGAEIVGNKVLLHFVDGQRGDDDIAADGSVTHTGAPVLITDIPPSSSSSVGCSIAATPTPIRGSGDWIVVSMFLAFVALVRRRHRLDRAETARH